MPVTIPIPVMYVVVSVMYLVYYGTASHKEHSFGHGMIEEVKHRGSKDNYCCMVLVIVVKPECRP